MKQQEKNRRRRGKKNWKKKRKEVEMKKLSQTQITFKKNEEQEKLV